MARLEEMLIRRALARSAGNRTEDCQDTEHQPPASVRQAQTLRDRHPRPYQRRRRLGGEPSQRDFSRFSNACCGALVLSAFKSTFSRANGIRGTKSSALPFIEETRDSPAARRRAFQVGPLIQRQRVGLRYGSAIGLLLTVALARFALVPLLGSQAPLLPFIVAVLAVAYVAGRGPALLACLLTPPIATVLFTHWPKDSNPGPWSAHLAFFVAVGVVATLIVDQLQRSYAAQQDALLAAQESEHKANASEARLRLVANSLPLLVAYVDRDLRYRFHNSRYFEWYGPDAGAVLGRHVRDVMGENTFQQRLVQFETALRGETVRFEAQQMHATLGMRIARSPMCRTKRPKATLTDST